MHRDGKAPLETLLLKGKVQILSALGSVDVGREFLLD